MRFKKYLMIINEMSVDKALQVLKLNKQDLGDPNALKKAYRKRSMESHPDRGGSKEEMQDVNDAYASLKRAKTSREFTQDDIEERRRQKRQLAIAVKTMLLSEFKPEEFIKYFSNMTKEPFNHNMIKSFPEDSKWAIYDSVGFRSEFFNNDRSIVFELDVYTFTSDIKSSGLLGYGSISFPLTTITYAFAHNKRHKFGKQEWGSTKDHAFLGNPEKIFPSDKVKKIIEGKARKKSKFTKRDMHTFLIKKLGAEKPFTDKGTYVIPIGDNLYVRVNRSVFMRQAAWMIFDIYEKAGKFSWNKKIALNVVTLPETEETLETFEEMQKELKKAKGEDAVRNKARSIIDKLRKQKGYK
jgi:curved DNA-binding protein CbpA